MPRGPAALSTALTACPPRSPLTNTLLGTAESGCLKVSELPSLRLTTPTGPLSCVATRFTVAALAAVSRAAAASSKLGSNGAFGAATVSPLAAFCALNSSAHCWTRAAIVCSGASVPARTAPASYPAWFSTAFWIVSPIAPRSCDSRRNACGSLPSTSRMAVETRLCSAATSRNGMTSERFDAASKISASSPESFPANSGMSPTIALALAAIGAATKFKVLLGSIAS